MRSIRLLAAVTGTLALGTACGGGSGVTPPSDTTPPTAAFTSSCTGSSCTFTNTSTDPDGTFTSSWDFGDGSAKATDLSPIHVYAGLNAVTPFPVVLTITDNGGLTATANQTVSVTPEATLTCNPADTTATTAKCTIAINQKATVTVTVDSTNCQFVGNTLVMPSPAATPTDTLFKNGCYTTMPGGTAAGTVYTLNGTNPDKSFPAATTFQAQFTQGNKKPTDPPKGAPAIQVVSGGFPDWKVAIDDGGNIAAKNAGTAPKFKNIFLTVHATLVP